MTRGLAPLCYGDRLREKGSGKGAAGRRGNKLREGRQSGDLGEARHWHRLPARPRVPRPWQGSRTAWMRLTATCSRGDVPTHGSG